MVIFVWSIVGNRPVEDILADVAKSFPPSVLMAG